LVFAARASCSVEKGSIVFLSTAGEAPGDYRIARLNFSPIPPEPASRKSKAATSSQKLSGTLRRGGTIDPEFQRGFHMSVPCTPVAVAGQELPFTMLVGSLGDQRLDQSVGQAGTGKASGGMYSASVKLLATGRAKSLHRLNRNLALVAKAVMELAGARAAAFPERRLTGWASAGDLGVSTTCDKKTGERFGTGGASVVHGSFLLFQKMDVVGP
jgi:hypothetical protein